MGPEACVVHAVGSRPTADPCVGSASAIAPKSLRLQPGQVAVLAHCSASARRRYPSCASSHMFLLPAHRYSVKLVGITSSLHHPHGWLVLMYVQGQHHSYWVLLTLVFMASVAPSGCMAHRGHFLSPARLPGPQWAASATRHVQVIQLKLQGSHLWAGSARPGWPLAGVRRRR